MDNGRILAIIILVAISITIMPALALAIKSTDNVSNSTKMVVTNNSFTIVYPSNISSLASHANSASTFKLVELLLLSNQ